MLKKVGQALAMCKLLYTKDNFCSYHKEESRCKEFKIKSVQKGKNKKKPKLKQTLDILTTETRGVLWVLWFLDTS